MTGVVLTGAAGGLGSAIGELLAARGDRLIGVDLRGADVIADLGHAEGCSRALADVRDLAGDSLDGVVVAAGIGPHVPDPALIVAINYFASVAFLDGLIDLLAAGSAPAAVAVSSNSATIDPSADERLLAECLEGDESAARATAAGVPGNVAYCTSKRALAVAVRRRVSDWGERGVRLNAVAPGAFDSPLLQGGLDDPTLGPLIDALPIPVGHRAQPYEVAELVMFLLSPAASYVHGSVLYADGGTDALLFPDRVP